MVYSFIHINTLYNQLSLDTEVLDASIIVGDSFDNLTQFNFNRQPTLGTSYEQLDRLAYYKEPVLTPDPPNHYELFMSEISQKTIEIYQELPNIAINFYRFSRKENFPTVQKWVNLNQFFNKNLRQTIQEEFGQQFHQTDSKTLVKLLLLLYKKHEKIEPLLQIGVKNTFDYTMQEGELKLIDASPISSLTDSTQTSGISINPLD